MALLKSKPTSLVNVARYALYITISIKGITHAALIEKVKKTGGRNNQGRITVRHIGGGTETTISFD